MTITPSLVSRLPAMRINRRATSFGNAGECRASKRSCTADETLLTFCPPGPEARTNDSESSDSSMEIVSVIRIIRRHDIKYFFARTLPSSTAGWSKGSTPRRCAAMIVSSMKCIINSPRAASSSRLM